MAHRLIGESTGVRCLHREFALTADHEKLNAVWSKARLLRPQAFIAMEYVEGPVRFFQRVGDIDTDPNAFVGPARRNVQY